MDLFVWLCGCLLAFLLPSAANTEEGGKFDTFLPPAQITLSRVGVKWKLTRFLAHISFTTSELE